LVSLDRPTVPPFGSSGVGHAAAGTLQEQDT
jgi:hypothetical protein